MHTGSDYGWKWFFTITDPLHQVRQRERGVSFHKTVNYFRLTAIMVEALNRDMGEMRDD
jgi:hypothetical protein